MQMQTLRNSVALRLVTNFWPMLLVFAFGAGAVLFLVHNLASASSDVAGEGAALALAIYGDILSILLPIIAFAAMIKLTRRHHLSLVPYGAILFVTLLPVVYLQCINYQSSLIPLAFPSIYPDERDFVRFALTNTGIYIGVFLCLTAITYSFARRS